MGDVLIRNSIDHPSIVRVEELNELFRRRGEADGQQDIQFIDDRQHDILIIGSEQGVTERKALDMVAGETEQLAGFKVK